MNDSIATYSAPNTVAIHAWRPSCGSIAREGRDRGEDDADGDEEEAAALEDVREGGVEDDDEGQHRAERREALVAGRAQEAEGLDRRRRP